MEMINNTHNNKPVRCTIKDVARDANVSITTVSAVLRNSDSIIISKNTKKRVIESAQKLNYHTNYYACKLQSKQSILIGFMVPDLSTPILAHKIESLIKALDLNNCSVIIRCSFGNVSNEEKVYQELLNMDIDALIIAGCTKPFADNLNKINQANRIPIISLEHIQPFITDTVTVDRIEGFYNLTKYLISLNHKKIGLLTPKIHLTSDDNEAFKINTRLIGYNRALREFGFNLDPNLIQELDYIETKHIFESTLEIVKRNPDMTALMVSDDSSAFIATSAIQSLGLDIPGDISVTGFDNLSEFSQANIPITTMAQPIDEIVNKTVDLLLKRISDPFDSAFQLYSYAPKLIVRNSTSENTKS